ncbi:MAG TPA: hypothetical protein VFU23_04705 [Gemmatimonadales bacterium]|nr:hypothetical protein [Gemmatimonadales bacterium]
MRRSGAALFLSLVCCRGAAPQNPADRNIAQLIDSLRPSVEKATGLSFKAPTRSEMKSREEVHAFLLEKLRQEFPPERQEGTEAVYQLLGLLPDTLNLKNLLLELYSEQVAGFYDPATSTMYGVRGAVHDTLRLVLAHELVHALQHQYLPLDSIMKKGSDADQQTAAQAVLEGHAMMASILVFAPDRNLIRQPQFWTMAREMVRTQASSMQVYAKAPLVLQEGMIFPYLNGAEWIRWWDSARAGHPLPTVAELPRSTEQILHPDRYARGDQPVPVRFADPDSALYEDTLGEREIQVMATVLRGGGEVLDGAALGWGGDRFRAYRTTAGPALVWYLVWDDEAAAARFMGGPGARLAQHQREGYRSEVTRMGGAARPTVRVVVAPVTWERWKHLPGIR